jgi:hypothetical protein
MPHQPYDAILAAPFCHLGACFSGTVLTRLDFLPEATQPTALSRQTRPATGKRTGRLLAQSSASIRTAVRAGWHSVSVARLARSDGNRTGQADDLRRTGQPAWHGLRVRSARHAAPTPCPSSFPAIGSLPSRGSAVSCMRHRAPRWISRTGCLRMKRHPRSSRPPPPPNPLPQGGVGQTLCPSRLTTR